MQKRLQRWVLRSGKLPPLRWLYALLYRLCELLLRFIWRLRFPCIVSITTHRGLSRADWVPGASDIDLRIVIEPLPLEREQAFLRAFWRHYAAAKVLLPFLGEVQIVTANEAARIKTWGGVRERPAEEHEGWKRAWHCLGEATSAGLFLLQQSYFSLDRETAPDYGHKICKGYLDASRYAAASMASAGPTAARGAWLEDPSSARVRDLLADPLTIGREGALELNSRAVQELDLACAAFLDQAAREPQLAGGPPAASPRWENDLSNTDLMLWKRRMTLFEQADLPKVHGFYYDGLYRWIVVADVDERPAVMRLLECMRTWHHTDPGMRNPPVLLSRAAFQVLLWSSYLDSPFLYYALSPSVNPQRVAARQRDRTALLGWACRAQWKMMSSDFLPPPKACLDMAVEQSLASLTLSLRLFGLDGWAGDNAYRVGLLYSRLMSAQLYRQAGTACDPDDMDKLLEAYKNQRPDSYAEIAGPLEEALNRSADDFNALPQEPCFRRHYPSYRMLLDRAMA